MAGLFILHDDAARRGAAKPHGLIEPREPFGIAGCMQIRQRVDVTVGATMVGKVDPIALFDALAADLSARGMLAPDRIAAARALVPGRLPVTALVDLGAPPDAVLRALATLCGAPPAPSRKEWKLESRAQLRVDELTWQRLLAVPIGFIDRKPLIAYADVIGITSSMALSALPAHVPCVALESDVRDALSRPVVAAKSGVSFLAPPSAVASAMPGALSSSAQAFGAGTAPNLGGTMVGAGAPATPVPAPHAQPSFAPSFAPSFGALLAVPLGAQTVAPLSPSAVPTFAPTPSQQLQGLQGTPSFAPPPMAGSTSPPGGVALSSLPSPIPGGAPSGSVIATMMATPLAPLPRIGTPGAQPAAALPNALPRTPSGTLLGTGSVPLDGVNRAPLHSISPGAPSFMGDAQSPSSPATGQSPFVPTEQPAMHRESDRGGDRGDDRGGDRGGDTAPMRTLHAQRNVVVSVGPGTQCGRYVLEKKLGEGGMATVFVARPMDGQGPTAAIKVVHEHLLRTSTGEELRRRFQREVNAMRQLHHKNIVACIDAGTVGDTEYLATELVSGGSLNRVLQRVGGRLSPLLALSFFGDLLEGLAHAHEKGVVHRDMKPDNILVGDDGTLKIADFGIARVAEGTQLTATGGIIGTPSYMSPEQALAAPVDARTDLYSAGVILYEIVTGRNPFEGDSVAATLGNVLSGKVRPVGEIEPALPFIADLVVMRLLSLRPDDRFPTARAALAALKPALDRAQEFRATWAAVVQKQPGSLAGAFAKESEGHATRARKFQRDLNDRTRAAHAAFRATSLMPDQREAKAVMSALSNAPGAAPIRLARSSTPALSNKEAAAERAQGDDRLVEYRAIAQMYLDEHNPVFAANYARRTAVEYGVRAEELALLARVLPEEEVDEVRMLDARLGITPPSSAETMMRKAAWRPPAPSPSSSSSSPSPAPAPAAEPALVPGGGRMPAYLKIAIVIAASAIPIVGAIVALRGCG